MTGWDSFAKYVGVQGILAIMFAGAIIYMMIVQIPITDAIIGVFGIMVGFFFGSNGRAYVNAVKSSVGQPSGDS